MWSFREPDYDELIRHPYSMIRMHPLTSSHGVDSTFIGVRVSTEAVPFLQILAGLGDGSGQGEERKGTKAGHMVSPVKAKGLTRDAGEIDIYNLAATRLLEHCSVSAWGTRLKRGSSQAS